MDTINKYETAKIYKVVDNAYEGCYIGSTIQSLSRRMALHRRDYKNYQNGKCVFITIYSLFDTHGVENCKIELIEEYPCENKEQLLKREGYYIRRDECLNKCIPGRTRKEYEEDNKEQIKNRYKQYREANIEKCKAKDKAYNEQNKERIRLQKHIYNTEKVECSICKLELSRGSLNVHRQLQHPVGSIEHLREKQKQRREDYKERMKLVRKKYRSTKVACPICNLELNRDSLTRHKKIKHPEINNN